MAWQPDGARWAGMGQRFSSPTLFWPSPAHQHTSDTWPMVQAGPLRPFDSSNLSSSGDQHMDKRAKMDKKANETLAMDCTSIPDDDLGERSKKDKIVKKRFKKDKIVKKRSKKENYRDISKDCASMPDDGQLYYDDNFEGILVKEFHSKMEKLAHQVEVDEFEVEVLRWDVRRCTLTRVKGCFVVLVAKELQFATSLIDMDANNFHAWSHRKWVLQTFGGVHTDKIWDEELVYCDKMVDKDPYNSLVWDHRYFVVTRCLMEYYEAKASDENERAQKANNFFWKKRDVEVDFAIKVIKGGGAGSPCPWSYLRSLYTVHSGLMALNSSVTSVVLWVVEGNANLKDLDGIEQRSIINALNMLLDLLSHGYRNQDRFGEKIFKALEALSPNSPPQPNKIPFILTNLERDLAASGLVWRNAGSEFLVGTSFERSFKILANKFWTKKAVGESFSAPATSLPAEKNEENDANAYLPLPKEPKLCNVRLHFPDKRKVRRDFLLTDQVKLLWSFCNSELKEKKPFRLTLSIRGALSTLDFNDEGTLGEFGLSVLKVSVTWK